MSYGSWDDISISPPILTTTCRLDDYGRFPGVKFWAEVMTARLEKAAKENNKMNIFPLMNAQILAMDESFKLLKFMAGNTFKSLFTIMSGSE